MTRGTKHRKDETSFKGEMIENELYKSADDVLAWDSIADNTSAAKSDFSSAPYFKVDEDEYSYPSKISKCKKARINVAFDDDTDGDLDVNTSASENVCQYAVVNTSRKIYMSK